MRRTARALAILATALLVATPIPAPPPDRLEGAAIARLTARPVALDPSSPDATMAGPLRYLEGWALSSDDRRFGGISALAVDGDHLLALSDHGVLLRFAAPPGDRVEIVPLAEGPGEQGSKADRDSESMVLAGGRLWVGYENSNEIWRYAAGTLRAEAHAAPEIMDEWSANRGAESLIRLSNGRFLAIREDVDDDGISDAALFLGDPAEPGTQTVPLRIDPPEFHRITDGAQLPDGRLLLVSRSLGLWSGWTARLLVAELPADLRAGAGAGALMPLREVAAFESPLTRDNMEALAIEVRNGRTIVWMASDDNLFGLQRTLLLKFEWTG